MKMLFEWGSVGARTLWSISQHQSQFKIWIQHPDVAAAACFSCDSSFFHTDAVSVCSAISAHVNHPVPPHHRLLLSKWENVLVENAADVWSSVVAANVKLWLSSFQFLTHLQLRASSCFTFYCITTQQRLWGRKTAWAAAGWSALCNVLRWILNTALDLKRVDIITVWLCSGSSSSVFEKLHLCATVTTSKDGKTEQAPWPLFVWSESFQSLSSIKRHKTTRKTKTTNKNRHKMKTNN